MAPLTVAAKAQNAARNAATPPQQGNPCTVNGLRGIRVTYTATDALADGDIVDFGNVLPRCFVYPLIHVQNTAFGADRTVDIGYQEHTNAQTGEVIASDIDCFVDGLDVATAANALATLPATMAGGKEILGSNVSLLAKVIGGTWPVNGTLTVHLLVLPMTMASS